jgi:hypothetical protein
LKDQKTNYGVSYRAVLIGLALAALECLVAPYNDYVIRNVFLAGGHFPVGPFFVLTILILCINVALKRINPKYALSAQELITVWCIMLAPAGIPSTGMMRYALGVLVGYKYYATPENEWETLFHQYIPEWRVVRDENAIRSFYEGLYPGESIPWEAWLKPLGVWTVYVLVMYFVVTCLAVLLRKQWVEDERCTFPLVQLPVEMSRQDSGLLSSFFKKGNLWIGFAIPVFIHTVNGLHAFFPEIPGIPVRFWIDPHLVGRPWSALRPFQIVLFSFMVGFSYLMTLEVSFSLWFFYLFFKLQCLIGSLMGFNIVRGPGVQWTAYTFSAAQEIGACFTFVVYTLWRGRQHIGNVFSSIFRRKSVDYNGKNEAMPYGLISFGLVVGIIILAFLNNLMGMSFWFAVIFVLVLLVIYIALTWQVIHGGIPFVNPSFSAHNILFTTLGTSTLNPSTLTSLFMHPVSLTRDLREIMMPNVMNGLKAADEVRVKRRQLLMGMGAAMVVGLLVSYYSALKVSYKYHAPYTGWPGDIYWLNSVLVGAQSGTDWTNAGFMIFGSVFMFWLMWLRQVFVWWPIHPIGYTVWSGWGIFKLWFSIFLGWSMKYSIIKYGGLKAYRKARPIFLGLVLGEMTCAGIWAIIGMATGVSTGYRILLD